MKNIRSILAHPADECIRYTRNEILRHLQGSRSWARRANFPKTEAAADLAIEEISNLGRPSQAPVVVAPPITKESRGTQTDCDLPATTSSAFGSESAFPQSPSGLQVSSATQTEACQTDTAASQPEVAASHTEQEVSSRSAIQQEADEISYDAYLKRKRLEEAEDAEVEALLLPPVKRRVVEADIQQKTSLLHFLSSAIVSAF
jgi:hypothetical protein